MRNQLSLKPFSSNSHHSWWNMQDCDLWIKLIFPNAPIKWKIILVIFRTDLLLSLQVNIVKVKRLTLWHRESVEGKWPTNYAYISLFFATQMFIYIYFFWHVQRHEAQDSLLTSLLFFHHTPCCDIAIRADESFFQLCCLWL